MERLMTTEEVAELLRIEPVTVRRLVMRGELPAYRVAGEYRFTQEDIKSYLESQRVAVNPSPKNMFAKFTDRARKVMTLAKEEAHQYQHAGIGPEHLLLALLDEGEGIGAKVLQELLQISADEIRKQVEARHPAEEHSIENGMMGLTPQGKQSIELAVQEAKSFGHHYIGTEHLLLGLLQQEESIAFHILQQGGVTVESARDRVKQLLAGL